MASLYLLLILTLGDVRDAFCFSLNTCTHGVPSTPCALRHVTVPVHVNLHEVLALSTYSSTTRAMIGRSLPQGRNPPPSRAPPARRDRTRGRACAGRAPFRRGTSATGRTSPPWRRHRHSPPRCSPPRRAFASRRPARAARGASRRRPSSNRRSRLTRRARSTRRSRPPLSRSPTGSRRWT